MLEDEGVQVDYGPPMEKKDLASMAEAVTVYFFCQGAHAAIMAGVQKFRDRFGDGAEVEIEDDE